MTEMTEQEAEQIMRQFAEGKSNVHSFFTNIIKSLNTTKTGYLNENELGLPKLPVRTLKELSVFCKDVADFPEMADYFDKSSENITSTSLSKDGILLKLSVTQKKEMADVSPKQNKENKGWFKKKDSGTQPQN